MTVTEYTFDIVDNDSHTTNSVYDRLYDEAMERLTPFFDIRHDKG
jgi:hypothetical protein